MKIAITSDIHLEFGDLNLQNTHGADVLILGGDIMVAQDLHDHPEMDHSQITEQIYKNMGRRQAQAYDFRNFLKRCSFQFPHVIYVAGNHEFYHGKFFASLDHLREECAKFPNIHFLERDTVTIDDVVFVGATLWTDCNKFDPLTLHALRDMMNDFRIIRHDYAGYRTLKPADIAERHKLTLGYFREVLSNNKDKKCVVVGHHSPSIQSVHPKYAHDKLMNGGYHSDLSEFILDHPQVKLWTHGHTHEEFDYMIGETRIVCNPRGYVGYEREHDNPYDAKIVEI